MTLQLKTKLDCLYEQYNRFEYIDPDPLLFVHHYKRRADREVAGFVGACFAYGRVEMIMKTVRSVLGELGLEPGVTVNNSCDRDLKHRFAGFRYRFASETHLVNLLMGLKRVNTQFGSLENCFIKGQKAEDETVLSGLRFLSDHIRGSRKIGHLLADPNKTSACKRSHLFLRWMVRKDRVDPGCWESVPAAKLIVPIDRHMHTAGTLLGFTKRKNADVKTALEITEGFKKLNPDDPVKYDFCLTRFGIRREMSMNALENIVC